MGSHWMARGAEAATVAGVGSGAPVAAAAAPASRSQRPSATPAHRCQRRALVAVRAARDGWGPQGHETFIVRLPFGVGDGGAVSLPGQPRILAGLAAAAAQAWAAARRGRGSALRGAGEDQAYTSSIHIKHTHQAYILLAVGTSTSWLWTGCAGQSGSLV